MIGCYDFCGHYEWTFDWLDRAGGQQLIDEYWEQAISHDASMQAWDLIVPHGVEGMRKYWQHSLEEEAAGYDFTSDANRFRIDMHACPSKGFLIRNNLVQFRDYCDHCMGWVGPMMKAAGFVVEHEHNHCGKCWWEFRRETDVSGPSAAGAFAGTRDVRLAADWIQEEMDVFRAATAVTQKETIHLAKPTPPRS